MGGSVYRVHPAIGIARVGDSDDFYLGPETMAGFPVEPGSDRMGGLPIKAGTEDELITSSDLRDDQDRLKRQAARFKIFRYDGDYGDVYPSGAGEQITVGSVVDGKTVTGIVWSVHLANKKTNWYRSADDTGILAWEDGNTPPLRNLSEGSDPNDPERLKKLTIDPGPRTIAGEGAGPVAFDAGTEASYLKEGAGVTPLPDYPKSFPSDSFDLQCVPDQDLGSLGELRTDDQGRLLVVAASGQANGWDPHCELQYDVNNDGWFDDVADGPVEAVLEFDDGSVQEVQVGAWVITTDPGYAPQTLNVVSLFDDVYDSWVRKLGLRPEVYDGGGFQESYEPVFEDEVFPIFRAAELQQWNTNLNDRGRQQHDKVGRITADSPPNPTLVTKFIRNPNDESQDADTNRMPLSLGDSGHSFLEPSLMQYFFLTRWAAGRYRKGGASRLGPGETLDKAVLANCLGGRFSPGIEMTYICRQPDIYRADWQTVGPFRIHAKSLDYGRAKAGEPFLSAGWTPQRNDTSGLEPGDVSKFMALPWHTDYNSCATHPASLPDPVVPGQTVSSGHYWSWPAERPVAVYAAEDVVGGKLGPQRFSVRGPGTFTPDDNEMGRYQDRNDIVENWQKIGVIIQGTAIEGGEYSSSYYLEVESRLDGVPPDKPTNRVEPWPSGGAVVRPDEGA